MDFNSTYHHTPSQLEAELIWIESAKQNPENFAPLYDKYYKQIFNYIYQRINDTETAADITSQVFFKALLNIKKYEFKGVPFASWLYRVASNELNQSFKTNKAQRTINADVSDLKFICEEHTTPFFEEYIPVLKKIISELNEPDLTLIELRFFEKRSFKEISELLEITEVNAKVKMHRLIEKLKIKMAKINT